MSDSNIKVITRNPDGKYSHYDPETKKSTDTTLEEELNGMHDEGFDIVAGGCAPPSGDARLGTRCTFVLQRNLKKLQQ